MRVPAIALFLAVAGVSRADWLFDIPMGRKIPVGTLKFEYRAETQSGGYNETRFGLGITKGFDATFRALGFAGDARVGAFDFAYTAVAPVPALTPGITFGVLDSTGRTRDGRRFYAAFTFREDFESVDGTLSSDITIGAFGGSNASAFAGFRIPLSRNFNFVAEHNGLRIATGFEWRFLPLTTTRVFARDGVLTLGVSLTTKF